MAARALRLALAALMAISWAWPVAAEDLDSFVFSMPYLSQLTESPYAGSNCGPASVTMILNAFGDFSSIDQIRDETNELQGVYAYDAGVAIEYLAAVVENHGLNTVGPYGSSGFHSWTLDEVREELRQGHAFIPQLHLASLPGHEDKSPYVDHYVVVYGLLEGGFIYADAAFPQHTLEGGYRYLDEEGLLEAWGNSNFPFVGFAVAPGEGFPSLLPTPTGTPTATAMATATPRPTLTPTPSATATANATATPTALPRAAPKPAPRLTPSPPPPEDSGLVSLLLRLPATTGAALGWVVR